MAPLPLLLLPGLDGTARLFDPLERALRDRWGDAVEPVSVPLKLKLPFSWKPETVLFCTRTRLNPKAI